MRPVWMLIVMLAFTACALGQQAAPPPAPANGSQPPAPAGKKSPKAKSQEELNAYTAAGSLTDPAAMEKAADDFAAKFPDSDLSPLLYRTVMRTYQAANNNDKLLEMSEKLLKSDPDDSCLLYTSQVFRRLPAPHLGQQLLGLMQSHIFLIAGHTGLHVLAEFVHLCAGHRAVQIRRHQPFGLGAFHRVTSTSTAADET